MSSSHDNAELPKVTPYFFQHQYLSVVAPMIDEKNGQIFETPDFLNTIGPAANGFSSPFSDNEISVEALEVDGKKIYVWKFPEPEFLREALFIAFVPVKGNYLPIAISIGQLVDWEISISNEKNRSTFGRLKKPSNAKECVDLLIERGALTGEIIAGEFYQEGYEGPKYRE